MKHIKTLEKTVSSDEDGSRVWKFVMAHWRVIVNSREQMRRCFKREEVKVNGKVAEVTKLLVTGDVVALTFDTKAAHEARYGQDKLPVVFEDDELAIVVKQSGKTMVAFGFSLPYSVKPVISLEGAGQVSSSVSGYDSAQGQEQEQDEEQDYEMIEDTADDVDDGDDDVDHEIPVNVSPALGTQKVPCATHGVEKASNGLIIVAKTKAMRLEIMDLNKSGKISRTFRVMCHGTWTKCVDEESGQVERKYESGELLEIDPLLSDASSIHQIRVVSVTLSNSADFITTLDVVLHSPALGINARRYFMAAGHPVIGNGGSSKPLKANRDKGLCMALTRVEFLHPTTKQTIVAEIPEPKKLGTLRDREEKACIRRQQSDLEELQKGGVQDVTNYDRKSEMPIAYIVGEKEFCGMRFKVSTATLIPRSSTETLVAAGIEVAQLNGQTTNLQILDVGTGSGCLLLALLHSLPQARGVGIDISQDALQIANMNMNLHDMSSRAVFQIGDLGNLGESPTIHQEFDILVCNPPYLDSSKAAKLTSQFSGTEHEPSIALFANEEGYGAYEMLASSLRADLEKVKPRILSPAAKVILEIGTGMGPRVKQIFEFLKFEKAMLDPQDSQRCLIFSVPAENNI